MGTAAGTLYPFTFQYCVALFFFGVGLFCAACRAAIVLAFLKKKLCTIVLPYFAFSAINLVVDAHLGMLFTEFVDLILAMFMGVRTKNSCSRPLVSSLPVRHFHWPLCSEEVPAERLAVVLSEPRFLHRNGNRNSLSSGRRAAHVFWNRQRDVLYSLLCFGGGPFPLFKGVSFSWAKTLGKGAFLGAALVCTF